MRLSERAIILAILFISTLTAIASAQVAVIDDIPRSCSNERKTFVRVPPFTIGPTWVLPCDNYCADNAAAPKTVWYPTTVCSGSVITSVRCVASSTRAGCFNVQADLADPRNFDCAANGAGWKCSDRPVVAECAFLPTTGKTNALKDISRPTTHAYCEKVK